MSGTPANQNGLAAECTLHTNVLKILLHQAISFINTCLVTNIIVKYGYECNLNWWLKVLTV